ncbi:hypothetical protein M0R45_009273 [Rubus argutus]|uniref:MHC class I antigen n=1 Tax=Rubus argutus TaxID=59490 RepID=A0AAW1Y427_RUBAR
MKPRGLYCSSLVLFGIDGGDEHGKGARSRQGHNGDGGVDGIARCWEFHGQFGTVEMAWVMDDLVVVVRSCHGEEMDAAWAESSLTVHG